MLRFRSPIRAAWAWALLLLACSSEGPSDFEGDAACAGAADCDDGIACTVDSCGPAGACVHEANHGACAASADACERCEPAVGCVESRFTTTELLSDKDFDALDGSWIEVSYYSTYAIFQSPDAHTIPNLAAFGPAPIDGDVQEHGVLSQTVTFPETTRKVTLSGRFQLYPGGTANDSDDSFRAALFSGGSDTQTHLFNVWQGVDEETGFWKAFEYTASAQEVAKLVGRSGRLQFEAFAWDSAFFLDSVSLEAEVCGR